MNYVERIEGTPDPHTRFRMDQVEAWSMEGMDLLVSMTVAHILSEECTDTMCMPNEVFAVLAGRTPQELEGLLLYVIRTLSQIMLEEGRIEIRPVGEEEQ